MAYLSPVHRPSSVRHAIKLNLLAPDEECLVLAKSSRLEIWSHSPNVDGLVMSHSKAIYGRISFLQKLAPPGFPTHHLFVGTERGQYFTLQWNPSSRQLETVQSFVDVSEKSMRDSQTLDRCLVDPSGQYIVMHIYEGVLNLVNVGKPKKSSPGEYLEKPQQVRISELQVLSSVMLHTTSKQPELAMLYQNERDTRVLIKYKLLDEKGQYSQFYQSRDAESSAQRVDPGASMLIPVNRPRDRPEKPAGSIDAFLGGVIVVGETTMTYFDGEDEAQIHTPLQEANIFVAWAEVDATRYILADDYGFLHLLSLDTDGCVVKSFTVKQLGKASKASVLVYLGYDILYVGSHEGDCQVVRLHFDTSEGAGVNVVQTMPNIAPILDFSIMDLGNRGSAHTSEFSSGQARLVTGSGVFQDGSLRSVRSGVGMEDIGVLGDIENIRGVYSLKSAGAPLVDTLVVSTLTETRIFSFDISGEIEEVESFAGLSMDEHTLIAKNLPGNRALQATPSAIQLLDLESGLAVATWKPAAGQSITAASANDNSILLSVDGTTLLSLDVTQELREIARQDLGTNDQVSCVYVPEALPEIGVVGFWKSGSVSIIKLRDLQVIQGETVRNADSAAIPRNLILAQVLPPAASGPTLFVAMMDGVVHTFNVDKTTFSLSGKKSIVLGTEEANFTLLPGNEDGVSNLFATCDHPSYIYASDGRIVYSAVTAESATYICPFDSEAYPASVIVATASDLRISAIDTERRTHVRTLPVHETVRRIAYSPAERAFGIGTIGRRLQHGTEVITSSFKLVDEINFANLGEPINLLNLDDEEQDPDDNCEIVEAVIRAELEDHNSEMAERFIVGTSCLDDQRPDDAPRGRILVIGIDANRSPYLIASYKLKGACRALGVVRGKIVAALVKTVVVYDYIETGRTSAEFDKRATYRTATCPVDLAVNGDVIAVADLTKSISLVQFKPGKGGMSDELVEVARHYQSFSATAVAHLEGESYIEADAHGNLLVLRRNTEGAIEDAKKRLEVTSELNLGEMVNRIRTVDVDVGPDAVVIPKAFLATTEGSIHLLGLIAPSYLDLLLRLQTRLATSGLIHTLGDLPFAPYRGLRSFDRRTDEPYRFVDGELIERFLDLREADQHVVAEGLGPSVESLRTMVESLRRLV